MVSITLTLYLANAGVSIHVSEMTGDILTMSPETVKSVCPECKDGEPYSFKVSGTLKLLPDGGCVVSPDPGGIENEAGEAPEGEMETGEMGEMSPGAAAIMSRGK